MFSGPFRRACAQAGSAADYPSCPSRGRLLFGPSRSRFHATLWYGHLTGCPSNSRGLIAPVTGRRSLRLRSVVKVRDLSHAQTEDTRLTARGPSRSSGRTARSRTRCRSLLLLATDGGGSGRFRRSPLLSQGIGTSHDLGEVPRACSLDHSVELALRRTRLLIAPRAPLGAACFSDRRARVFTPRCGASGWYGLSSNSRGCH